MKFEPNTKPIALYYAPKNKRLLLGANKMQPEKRFPNGQIEQSSGVIEFSDHTFSATNKTEVRVIEESDAFKQGRIVRLTKEEFANLNQERTKNRVVMKPISDHPEPGTDAPVDESDENTNELAEEIAG